MLITPDDIRKHRPIAGNLDDQRRLVMYIQETETLDIIPAIGAELYKDCDEHPENYKLLLDGGYYNDDKQYFAGLKAAASLLAYARFLPNNNINVTPFGVKEKLSIDSGDVSDKALFRQINETRNTGLAYLQHVLDYLRYYNHNNGNCTRKYSVKRNNKFKAIGT